MDISTMFATLLSQLPLDQIAAINAQVNTLSLLHSQIQIPESVTAEDTQPIPRYRRQVSSSSSSQNSSSFAIESFTRADTTPPWIIEINSEATDPSLRRVYFNPTKFDIKGFAGLSIRLWYENNVQTSTWSEFNLNINKLVKNYANQLETFFSSKSKPKHDMRMMNSTERHHLAACIAMEFPLLMSKYAEFQNRNSQGENLGADVFKTTFSSPTFMALFHQKLTKRFDYNHISKSLKSTSQPTIPLRKPAVSAAMKRSYIENPRHQVKKTKLSSSTQFSH